MVVKKPPYTFLKDGTYYFNKSIPKDLHDLYVSTRISMSLRTKSAHKAAISVKSIMAKLDDYWMQIRLSRMSVPAQHMLVSEQTDSYSQVIRLSQAKDHYITLKGVNRSDTFYTGVNRNIDYVIQSVGDKPLDQYSSIHAGAFRDWLSNKDMKQASIRRVFNTVKAVVNLAISEFGLECKNPFAGVFVAEDITSKKVSRTIDNESIRQIQSECIKQDDELRHLIALISDTGMRLAEAVGLRLTDLHLDKPIPYVVIEPTRWRSLKTQASERKVPLVGMSLWAAKRIKQTNEGIPFCFPRYCNYTKCNANSASAALNKWLKTVTVSNNVVHGFRHSFRDRLRDVDTPTELIEFAGGWSLPTIGQSYGDGYRIEKLHEWVSKIVLPVANTQ